jgi:glycosyltransferase involved in cell wall biosynthesis
MFLDQRVLQTEHPVLLIAGRFDGMESELFDLVARLSLQNEVRFLGEVEDVPSLLAGIDLYLHSSRTEGSPNAVLEAMSMALPVVATDIPGIREAVGPSGLRYLVPGDNPQRMADLIEQFAADPVLRSKVGDSLKNYVMERNTVERMVDDMMSTVSHCLRR